MRVIHVITRLIIGGAQENTIASVLGLREKPDVHAHLISGPAIGPEGSLISVSKLPPDILTILPSLVRPINPWKDLAALLQLASHFRSLRPDIVHTHSGKAGMLGRLAAHRAGVPCILHTIHGPSFGPFQGTLSNAIFRAAERFAGRRTTHFVSVADAMTAQYLSAGIGSPEIFTRIYSGFDLQPFLQTTNDPALRARFGLAADNFVVGKIARLFTLKGHEDLLAAAPQLLRQCPRIKFLLVGDGILRPQIEAKARAMGVDGHFVFAGLVPPAEIPGLIGIMDAVAHLSLREGLPRALPQALAAGRPVVAYDCDGAREVCLSGKTGFLIKPGDIDGLAARLLLLASDKALRADLGRQGRDFVRDRFATARMVDDLYKLYKKLVASEC